MHKIVPPDFKEREKIERELDKNFLVEAGAGSGKTTSLVKRMVSLIISEKYKAGEIAAITFTRKAAAELKERFQNALEKAYRETEKSEISKRLSQALLELDQCFLGTIHSFCAGLLRERPVEAGLDPGFKELDDPQNRALVEKTWESYLIEARLFKPELMDNLKKIGVSPEDLKSSYTAMTGYLDVNFIFTQVKKPKLDPALNKLMLLVEKACEHIPDIPVENRYDALQQKIKKCLRYKSFFDLKNDIHKVELLSMFEKSNHKVIQKLWNSRERAKEIQEEFNLVADGVIAPVLKKWKEYCHYHIMKFLVPGVEYFKKTKERQSYLNFQDLLIKTAEMLRDYPEVRKYFQDKYKCLLIDEFQDTDPIQSEIMFYLTGSDTVIKDWSQLVPRPGSLFVVGDPKQSIYRFRRADIDTYNLVKKIISASGGEILNLTTNFRSLKPVGDFCNSVFKTLFLDEENPYQALFSPVSTIRREEEHTDYGVRVIEIEENYSRKTDVVEEDARLIAGYIKHALEGHVKLSRTPEEISKGVSENPRPQDFLIILRYKEMMECYARALEEYGIPVSMAGGSSLTQNIEIYELNKILRAVEDPDNKVYLAAVLRGLFFGISDSSLFEFKKAGGNFHIFSTLPDCLDGTTKELFREAFDRLKKYYLWSRRLVPSAALEKIVIDLGLVPYALSLPLGKSRCSYILQILEHLKKAEVEGAATFSQILEQFQMLLDSGLEEELNIQGKEEEAVRLMNLHKSKGLEAPVVILANPCKYVKPDAETHIRRTGLSPSGYFTFTKTAGFSKKIIAQPLDWEKYGAEELKYLEAEEIRLLYVAATRAKNLLIISKSKKDRTMKKNPWRLLIEKTHDNWALNEMDMVSDEPDEAGIEKSKPVTPKDLSFRKVEAAPDLSEAGIKDFNKWISTLAQPGFKMISPTDLKKGTAPVPVKRLPGGGMLWGNIIHRVMEDLVKGTVDLDTSVAQAVQEFSQSSENDEFYESGKYCEGKEKFKPGEIQKEVIRKIERFKSSELWERILCSQTKLVETPFFLKIEKGHRLYDCLIGGKTSTVIISGTVDLAFKEADGWIIVDYKTDRVEDEKGIQILTDFYSGQVKIYALAWEEITGEKVTSAEIYFVHLNESRIVYRGR